MEAARTQLIKHHEFYANLLYRTVIFWSDKIPTAGVRIANNRIEMLVNREFWNSMSTKHQVGILMHEIDHIIMGHIVRGEDAGINHKIMNLGADLAINQHNDYIQDFPGLHIDQFNEQNNMNLERGREMEYYARNIKQEAEKQSGNESGDGIKGETMDSHEMWGDIDISEELQEEIVKGALQDAADSTQSGNVPSNVLATINKLGKPHYNWKRVLAKFLARTQNNTTKSTRSRSNRRFGLREPGRRMEVKANVVCCIDTSGSVSDDMLSRFAMELNSMVSKGIDVTIIEADHSIQRTYKLGRGGIQDFKGRGGTAYTPAIKAAEELNPDAILYFTDGDCADVPSGCKVPFMWVLTTQQDKPGKFGKVMRIPES